MKTKTTILLALLALGSTTLLVSAQDNNNDGPPGGTPPRHNIATDARGHGGFHLLPPRAAEQLKLTDDQKTQVAALEADTKAKLEKILTPEQMTQLKNMRPPMHGGPGQGGPGGDHPNGPPPGEGDGSNSAPPSGPPSGDK